MWLRADPAVLADRIRDDGVDRPLLAAGPLPTLVRLAATRDAAYRAVADTEVSTEDRAPDAVVDAVVEEFARCARDRRVREPYDVLVGAGALGAPRGRRR